MEKKPLILLSLDGIARTPLFEAYCKARTIAVALTYRIYDETAASRSATNVPITNNETQTTTERAGITKIFLARKEFAAISRTPQHRKKLSDIGG